MYDRTKGKVQPTGREHPWPEIEIIITKTDPKGIITSVNDTFLEMAELTEEGALGKPHNIIRHPDMPRCVFKMMWDTLLAGQEVYAYVKNMSSNGDHYWTFAWVTPVWDANGNLTGYDSKRQRPNPRQIAKIEPIYKVLLEEEMRHESPKEGMDASLAMLEGMLKERHLTYNQFVFSI